MALGSQHYQIWQFSPHISNYATKCGSEYYLTKLLGNICRLFIVYDRGAGEVGAYPIGDVDSADVLQFRGCIAVKSHRAFEGKKAQKSPVFF